jgi:hypothetical protein
MASGKFNPEAFFLSKEQIACFPVVMKELLIL